MSLPEAHRRFQGELRSLIDKKVLVRLADGRTYRGTVVGIDINTLSLVLSDAETDQGSKISKVIVHGSRISEIIVEEEAVFEPREFADFIVQKLQLPPHAIEVSDQFRYVIVYHKYKITESGVEGEGPFAQRLYDLLQEYLRSKQRKSS